MFGFIKRMKAKRENEEKAAAQREENTRKQFDFHTKRDCYADGWQDLAEVRARMNCLIEAREHMLKQGDSGDVVVEMNKSITNLAKHLGDAEFLPVTGYEALQIKSGRALKIVDRVMPI